MKLCGFNLCFPGFNRADGAIQLPDDDDSENFLQGITPIGNTSPDFLSFLAKNPEYNSPFLDALRHNDFKRLDDPCSPSCYMDYTGAGLYPESLAKSFADQLTKNVYGNPLVTSVDSHNSVNGMRAFADRAGAKVEYLELPDDLRGHRISSNSLTERLLDLKGPSAAPGLLVATAQSNITGLKAPIHELVPLASSLGYTTLLDAAALLPTSRLSLGKLHGSLDAVAFSIYKMAGLPTGLDKALNNSLGARVAALTYWTVDQMTKIKHELHGGLIAFEVMDKTGEYVSCDVIEYAASMKGISLRAGCMCNPGGGASIMKTKEVVAGFSKRRNKERHTSQVGCSGSWTHKGFIWVGLKLCRRLLLYQIHGISESDR
ncbi:hypothetical protein Pst134EA_031249 [Puccinia striiformis f. sp. tritici]|uniref:uncharacterized protein n=1 Tax=Puccinia striiformis f. sp. tritici TaxID=168172 RepID=UPI0020072BB3|nr:uncharacterized protein Pst134EA_031249 [Puccinia striiformis f. sp. tritici]KAH9443412.1 hypothetical protein Pst134EA_031249 [Puccinia striiformis f. sp. tritici]